MVKLLASVASLALVLSACVSPTPTPAEVVLPTTTPVPATVAPSPTELPTVAPTDTTAAPAGKTFTIAGDQSEARFVIGEVLAGKPNRVIGVTHDVQGTFTADYANATEVSFSPVRVDMSTLVTDNPFRNRTLQDNILQTGDPANRYAEFVPKSVTGLPATIEIGTDYNVEVTGDMTLHGVTKELTFTGTVKPVSEKQVTGLLSVSFAHADFGVQVLRLPQQVASVEDMVTLELEFVANAE